VLRSLKNICKKMGRRVSLVAIALVTAVVPWAGMTQQAYAIAPSAPVNVKAYTGGNSIAVTWNPVTGETPSYYVVYRNYSYLATVMPTTYNQSGTTQRYIDTTVTNGQSYTYNVTAFSVADEESAWGTGATITHTSTTVPTVTLDASVAAASLTTFMNNGKAVIQAWYPKMVHLFGNQAGTPTTITLKAQTGAGLAYASGNNIVFDTAWATANQSDPTAMGVFVHEAAHVAQSPDSYMPWIHEGLADWMRGYVYADHAYTVHGASNDWQQGYGVTAYFFQWISTTFSKPNFTKDLFNSFTPDQNTAFFKTQTGLSVGQLWEQMTSKRMSGPTLLKNVGASMKCLDLKNGSTANGNDFHLQPCVSNPWAQTFVWTPDSNTSTQGSLKNYGKCADVAGSGTANGTKVQVYTCNSSVAQKWIMMSDGSLQNPNSGKCLQPVAGGTADGTVMEISTCTGANIQDWFQRPPGMLKSQAGEGCVGESSWPNAAMIYSCNHAGTGQNWEYVQATPGATSGALKSRNNGYCLEPLNASTVSGTIITSVTCDGSTSQEWQWQSDNTVKNIYTNLCLTLPAWASPWELTQTTCASPTNLKKFDVLYQY
jgi:hypothetical protein